MSDLDHRAGVSSKLQGGIHFFGLCAKCNGDVQALWDPAYCELAKGLWTFAIGDSISLPFRRLTLPPIRIRPGAVARSVLIGCFALNPRMREMHTKLAKSLEQGSESIDLSDPLSLHLALTKGPQARVTGSIGGFYLFRPKVMGRNLGFMSIAQIYFPPLAWQLADAPLSMLLTNEGWVDVSSWLTINPTEVLTLSDLVADLPFVVHPTQQPGGRDDWVELLADETCVIVESDNAIRSTWS